MCGKSSSPPVPNSTSTAFQSATSPNAAVLPYYLQYLQAAQNLGNTPFNPAMLGTVSPMTSQQTQAGGTLFDLGMNLPSVANTYGGYLGNIANNAQDIGNVGFANANQLGGQVAGLGLGIGADLAPITGFGMGTQGRVQPVADLGMGAAGAAAPISAFGMGAEQRVQPEIGVGMQAGTWDPAQVQQIMSPYIQNVVDATQNQFNNQNAIQASNLLSQGIRQGNAFGGDREGIAAAQMANQQQLAQAPVIANLYQQGYGQALQQFDQLLAGKSTERRATKGQVRPRR